jgi:hypothetical protein
MPSATIMTAVIAAGAPKPASASISVPKQKAISTTWMRRSSETDAIDRRSTAKCPDSTVIL